MSISQGTTKISGSPQKLGERNETNSPLGLPEGTYPADTLVLDFWTPELRQNKFLLF